MESAQLERPQGHTGDEQQPPHRGGAGVVRSTVVEEEEQHDNNGNHHEKQSVMKKVKAKAKKIKDTFTHPGHRHDHDHDDEESPEDDDEMVDDPNVHGGHIGGDGAVTSTVIQQKIIDENPNKDRNDSGHKEIIRPGEEEGTGQKHQQFVSETHHTSSHGNKGGFLQPEGLEEDPHTPSDRPAPPSNYQSKTFDPTAAGGQEARISPLVESFEKMDVGDDTKPGQNIKHKSYTESHDQFAPEPVATNVHTSSKDTESIPKTFDPNKPEHLPRDPLDGKPSDGAKTASPVDNDKVAGAGNAVMEKIPVGKPEHLPRDPIDGKPSGGAKTASPVDNDKVAGGQQFEGEGKSVMSTVKVKLAPVYNKVAAVGSTLVSKAQGRGTGQAVVVEGNEERTDKGVSITEYLAEKLKPGEEDKALSDVISGTLSRQKEETGEGKAVGRVTESEEVAKRLGPIGDSAREGSEEKGMVDMLRGTVNSWLGRDNQPQTTNTTNVRNEVSPGEEVQHQGERRLEHQNAMAEGRSGLQESGH